MKKIQLACLVSFLAAGAVQASTPCNDFQIIVKNKLPHDLITTTLKLHGAEIEPSVIQKLDQQSSTVFVVKGSTSDTQMKGQLIFHTLSLPSKEVKIEFNLDNRLLVCEHTNTSPSSDFPVGSLRSLGKVTYTIG